MTRLTFLAAGVLALASFTAAEAQEYRQGDLTISHPWARPAAEGQNSAAYLSIENKGSEADKIASVESPVAAKTMLHETIEEGGVMKMRAPADGIEVPAGGAVEFKPGGYHIMLIGLKQTLTEGQTIPLTLTFAKAGAVSVNAAVEKSAAKGGMDHMDHHMH